jgi:FkbM family methyltransferase
LHRAETAEFLALTRRCRTFLDLGCAEGFFSALFVAARAGDAQVLSVDCGSEQGCHWSHLELTRRCNLAQYPKCRMGDVKAVCTSAHNRADRSFKPNFSIASDCSKATLADILSETSMRPDFIKFDIEGSEYDVILDSLSLLRELRPVIQVELHNNIMPPGSSRSIVRELQMAGFVLTKATRLAWGTAQTCHAYFAPVRI